MRTDRADPQLLVREFAATDEGGHGAAARGLRRAGCDRLNFTAVAQDEQTTLRRAQAGQCWVVQDDGQLVATLTMSMPPEADLQRLTAVAREPHRAWLNQVAVAPPHRGRGIAAALWHFGSRWAKTQGAESVGLDTASKALHLVELYQGWGFVAADVIQLPGKTYRSVVMIRDPDPDSRVSPG